MAASPDIPAQQYAQALDAFRHKRFDEAERLVSALLQTAPAMINAWRLKADILAARGLESAALECLRTALSSVPPDSRPWVNIHLQQARLLIAAGRQRGALEVLAALEFSTIDHSEPLSQAAYLYSLCGDHRNSLLLYEKVLSAQPHNAQLLFNCAAANRAMGHMERAELLYDRLLEVRPGDVEAYKNRADLRRQTPEYNHIDSTLSAIAGKNWPAADESQLQFALAKEYEDLGEYEKSFAALERACQLRRSVIRYHAENDRKKIDDIIRVFDRSLFEDCRPAEEVGKAPERRGEGMIFVLGMPRTGTTLVDRVLCSSGRVLSAGEPGIFARELSRQVEATGMDQDPMLAASGIDFARLGANYLTEIAGRVPGGNGEMIIDKNPMNFLYVGLIRLALPAAKVVHLCRDPRDSCYAILKTQFRNAYPFSYDQVELAKYYLQYQKLMEHWRNVVPGSMFDLNYEELVQDFNGESRRLFEYCGLAWSEDVNDFHRHDRQGTATASASQVRQPVYTSSVGRWKRYAPFLGPMLDVLRVGSEAP